MLLKNPQRIEELFDLLQKVPSTIYQDNELNEAWNNALLLEEEKQSIIA